MIVFLKNITSRAWAGKTGNFDIWMAVLLLYILQNHLPQSLLNYDHPHTHHCHHLMCKINDCVHVTVHIYSHNISDMNEHTHIYIYIYIYIQYII